MGIKLSDKFVTEEELVDNMAGKRITVLVENTAAGAGFLAEHGLSFWIELGRNNLLFDTGQGHVLKNNAQLLGVRLESVNIIILSHGHYDHTGGLSIALQASAKPRVYAHPEAFAPKYACQPDGSARNIGMPALSESDVRSKSNLTWVEGPTEIGAGFWLTGTVPRTNEYEDTGGPFFRDKDCREPDELPDDQAAFLETKNGTVVILGCAHAGVINTLNFIQTLTSNRPILMLMGGMHLLSAGPQRIAKTIAALHRLNIQRLMPCHCTGLQSTVRLWHEFPGRCIACPVGTSIQLED
jgi:7,8-dihydropterin-6-yl-methyl-4-(beta-D-ribofuranosyl)aminobenzene 5'-phosphate synthase